MLVVVELEDCRDILFERSLNTALLAALAFVVNGYFPFLAFCNIIGDVTPLLSEPKRQPIDDGLKGVGILDLAEITNLLVGVLTFGQGGRKSAGSITIL